MIGRSQREASWSYQLSLAVGYSAQLDLFPFSGTYSPSPNNASAFGWLNMAEMRYFSIDVWTDDAVVIDIDVAPNLITATGIRGQTLTQLVCIAGPARHFTTYDLPAPFNRYGYLVITGCYMRLWIHNPTGNIVDPFDLRACAWR